MKYTLMKYVSIFSEHPVCLKQVRTQDIRKGREGGGGHDYKEAHHSLAEMAQTDLRKNLAEALLSLGEAYPALPGILQGLRSILKGPTGPLFSLVGPVGLKLASRTSPEIIIQA